jgi:predicted RNA-binding protein with TRAM domain
LGASGDTFTLHVANVSDDGDGWYSYDAYVT